MVLLLAGLIAGGSLPAQRGGRGFGGGQVYVPKAVSS